MVHHWLPMKLEDDVVIHNGLVHAVGWRLGVLYADDGLLGFWDPEWLQGAFNILIGLLLWIGLMYKVAKSKTMKCHQGTIWSGISEVAFDRKSTGKVATYQDRLQRRLQ